MPPKSSTQRKTRRVTIDEKPRGRGGGNMPRYRKESLTRVEGYEDNMDSGDEGEDARGEAENSRSSGSHLESLFAALQAQTAQKTSSRRAVFLTKMKVMCEEYKLDATQSLEEVHRSELDKGIELLATLENDDVIEEAAKAFGKRHLGGVEICEILSLYDGNASNNHIEVSERAYSLVPSHRQQMERSRKRVMKAARNDYQQGLENQKLASDARAYINQYKKLIMM